jgi:hypothetical protein
MSRMSVVSLLGTAGKLCLMSFRHRDSWGTI